MPIRVAVLTVSDTASKIPEADKSGPLIKSLLLEYSDFQCLTSQIVPDEESAIKNIIRSWCNNNETDWIITAGGTGFGVRDRTPEAVSALLERQASGILHFLLSSSISSTPLAALSRPVAGIIRNTLVITLPGSTRAVEDNLRPLLSSGIINHAIELLKGGTGREFHSKLVASDRTPGHSHSHHHDKDHHEGDHRAPKPRTAASQNSHSQVTSRHRISPYPLVEYEQALHLISLEMPQTEDVKLPVSPALRDYVLAEDVYAPFSIPSIPTTNVDGYAVRCHDLPGHYNVVTSHNHSLHDKVPEEAIYRINTGAPLPNGTDSVIMVEDTKLISTHVVKGTGDELEEEKVVQTLVQVPFGENVRAVGSDVKSGELVMHSGDVLRGAGGEIGTLAFIGCREVLVRRKPLIALLSTGNELMDLQQSQSSTVAKRDGTWSGVWDTNRPSLLAAMVRMGYEVVDLGIVNDDIISHVNALKDGFKRADVIVTTGGTSMGASDLLKPVIENYLQGTIHFGRVAIRPGKPTTFATVYHENEDRSIHKKKAIFALPGNPASALVTFYIFIIPALRQMSGWPVSQCQLPRVRVKLMESMLLDSRVDFHRLIIHSTKDGLKASSTGGQRSSRVASLKGANGLAILPSKTVDGRESLDAGEFVDAIIIDEIYNE